MIITFLGDISTNHLAGATPRCGAMALAIILFLLSIRRVCGRCDQLAPAFRPWERDSGAVSV
ncbi:hypothetical protein [Antarcticimicrobium luteum]|uniref:Uncharacterized protein n=1 Tax=Antarcticimicrobium luteum TaxID=2547397 RepID=A0A4R5V1I4_9RHOB|nr:hypothetical protein [Antarcticimicrobium luteum]TDK45648.1 hypothetical protein E1832_13360 [Antarcticimicrobium luteum]